ncbi:2-amino-4-hydroxy-6-hydroxymethyldihydropteridine diphosphokinase [Roseibium hamelinense]|uniref:2-amino-4-hydroxy-6- hydroxymethyldihydropteridine diphosphokinase n=1 Tax=Roseibium hamelinense TaxID=150831 RepID=UPI001AD8DCE1|nr:2-amino-4-hydroxy-6-hydroxymethyldihydropteridine diphosphokinase [Roseibium hamelinense]
MTPALIALGSNLGDRRSQMIAGLKQLSTLIRTRVVDVSPLYETAPVGGPDNQGAYLNAAALVETHLDPKSLLEELQKIEKAQRRERIVRWGPRTLDLDILVYGDLVTDDEDLTLPHPRMHDRRFVMVPAADIAADYIHPGLNQTMGALLAALPVEPGDLTAVEADWGCSFIHPTTTEKAT